jgi:hypothetical protein
MLQRGRVLDRGQVARVAPLAHRLDRAAQQLAGARLRQRATKCTRDGRATAPSCGRPSS